MKKTLIALGMAMVLAMGAGAKAPQKETTAVFTVSPKMSCANCENKIKSNLRFEKGVSSIVTDIEKQTVTVRFNPAKTDSAKIVKAFSKIGYKALPAAK